MAVFVFAQIHITDRNRYADYEGGFLPIFEKYQGTAILIPDLSPG